MPKSAKKKAKPAVADIWDDEEATPENDSDVEQAGADETENDSTEAEVDDDIAEPTDDELGEEIDGGEDEITEDFEERAAPVPVAVDVDGDENPRVTAAVKAAVTAATKKKETGQMKKTSKKEMTKADHIRAEVEKRKNAGSSVRPKDIIEALAKKNIEVTAPQVSVLVRKLVGGETKGSTEGATPVQRAKEAISRATRAATAVKKPPIAEAAAEKETATRRAANKTKAAPQKTDENYTSLFAAANFVGTCGGLVSARNTLDAYEKLTTQRT